MTQEVPLVIDLDGTLLRSDLLLETGLVFLRDHPGRCLAPLGWLWQGKAVLKEQLALATLIDVAVLPYDERVIAWLQTQKAAGSRLILATASHRILADRVAQHLGLFDAVMATEAGCNLASKAKRDALVAAFGLHGFDYAGNDRDDLPVWSAARKAHVVNAKPSVQARAQAQARVVEVMPALAVRAADWLRALRWHQWAKNFLLFVPLVMAHMGAQLSLWADAWLAFLCFGCCASSVYVLNDLLDLQDDRHHERKRSRAFASGKLSIRAGLAAFVLLLSGAFSLALYTLPLAFSAGLAVYFSLTMAYSLTLKRRMVVDVITLATLYTLRIIVGALALGIALRYWLLTFSMFIFLSLALVKRYAELFHLRTHSPDEKARGRGYFPDDLQMIAALGAAAGYMSVMVLALYINDPHTIEQYRHPELIWLACPLLLTWISRIWMLTHRGFMNDDPVIFALRDRVSLLLGALLALVFGLAA